MLNRYPLWKYLLIVCIVALGVVYALPNLYPDDPAIQISGTGSAHEADDRIQQKSLEALTEAGIAVKADELGKSSILIRLQKAEQQQLAKSVIKDALGDNYIVAPEPGTHHA